jgi:hypothetical protein
VPQPGHVHVDRHALVIAIALARTRPNGSPEMASAATVAPPGSQTAGTEAPKPAGRTSSWQCVCGQPYRVSGLGRHRIYWPLDSPVDQPVMDGCCIRCGRPLPGKHPHCKEAS